MNFYIISPPEENINFTPKNFNIISDILKVDYFQFRPKFKKLKDRINFVKKYFDDFKEICQNKKIKIIINNDFEIAKKFFFDGIHLGQEDRLCKEARKVFGIDFQIGVSCNNSIEMYKKAKVHGANYVAYGPMFKSKTKNKKKISKNKILQIRENIKLPLTLIGGINHSNFLKLRDINPSNIAIIDSIWNFKNGPSESAELFKKNLIYGVHK
ncbi:MAG: hypothetical protein CMM99_02710 [Rickettsiales bacterium]|nr:hypothetical protein [Rickettsiales bacterium]